MLNHFDELGQAVMVDVHGKDDTFRTATACGRIHMCDTAFAQIREGGAKKGDVLGVARIAGIMAAKRTSELIPLCHNIPLASCCVEFRLLDEEKSVEAICTASCTGKTGVEMEALTGVSTALLTIYDMVKDVSHDMQIGGVHLVHKDGGKSGCYNAKER